jgi:4-diphosphocytidyl-2-C-methyl-D-erythritol kinase
LGLHILFKREDGYHELETMLFQLPILDVLEVNISSSFSFQSSGLPISGAKNDNLCVKAFQLMKEKYNIQDVTIHLHKNIPMGGGLGGGSSDGTYVLLALNEIFNINLTDSDLQELAAQLGSDCAVFVKSTPQIARGRGEVLEEIPFSLAGYWLKVVNVGVFVSTQQAFTNIEFVESAQTVPEVLIQPIESWKENLVNDFERTVFKHFPALQKVKDKLYAEGAIYASMSGSGSTLYGIYKDKPELSFKRGDLEQVIFLE